MCRWQKASDAYSPPGPRTLRERERERDHDSPQHAVDGVQSDSQAALSRQCGASNFGEGADIETEKGLAVGSWRADVTLWRLLLLKPMRCHSLLQLDRWRRYTPAVCTVVICLTGATTKSRLYYNSAMSIYQVHSNSDKCSTPDNIRQTPPVVDTSAMTKLWRDRWISRGHLYRQSISR